MNTTSVINILLLPSLLSEHGYFLFLSYRETLVERETGEAAEQRIARAIRVAARWYSDHLRASVGKPGPQSSTGTPALVLLSDDPELRQTALERDQIPLALSSSCFASRCPVISFTTQFSMQPSLNCARSSRTFGSARAE